MLFRSFGKGTLQRFPLAFLLGFAGVGPVSYTHLDVYKRQAGIRGAAAKQQRLIAHGLPVNLIHFHLLRGQ